MADRVVDPENDTPQHDIDDVLKAVIQAVLNEAVEKMENGEDIIPFTGLAVKENLFIETHPGDTAEDCFLAARREVQGARGATAYAFCYDGYIDTEDGIRDAIIAEGGLPGEEEGYAFGYLYDDSGIQKEIVYIGGAPNFMKDLKLELEIEGSLDPTENEPQSEQFFLVNKKSYEAAFSFKVASYLLSGEEQN